MKQVCRKHQCNEENDQKLPEQRRTFGKNVGDIGMTFEETPDKEQSQKVEEFIAKCLKESCYTAVDYDSMISNGLVTVGENHLLTCTKCEHKTTRQDHMKQHLAHHYKDFSFKCKFCDATCTTETHFKVHLRKHTGIPTHKCDQCTFATFTSTSLQSHMNHVHCSAIRYRCPACRDDFQTTKDLFKHTKLCPIILGGTKLGFVACRVSEKCSFECKLQKKLVDHMKTKHSIIGACCSYCPVVEKDRASVNEHTKLHKSYLCKECDYMTNFKSQYLKHFLKNHNSNDYPCYFCGEISLSKRELDQHEQRHVMHGTNEPNKIHYKCIKCDYTTAKSKILLKKHCRRIHSLKKQLCCDQCTYKCSELAQLNLHMRKHTNTQSYLCHDCGFTCKWPSQMRLHNIKHTGKKPYKCEKCPYEAFRSDSITAHMMHKHKSSGFILCDKCGHSLPTQTAFNKHMRTHDSGEDKKHLENRVTLVTNQASSEDAEEQSGPNPCIQTKEIQVQFSVPPSPNVCCSTNCQSPLRPSTSAIPNNESTSVTQLTNSACQEDAVTGWQYVQSSQDGQRNNSQPSDVPFSDPHRSQLQTFRNCFLCPFKAKSNNSLYQHMCREHRCQFYQCNICPFRSSIVSKWLVHRMEHMGVKPILCDVENCRYKACSDYHLQLHKRKHEIGTAENCKRLLKCRSCAYTTKWRNQLKLHQQKIHTGLRDHKCQFCDYACYRADVLKSHMLHRHSNVRPYKCTLCAYTAKEARSLQKHMVKHRSERLHTCTTCGKSFKSRPVLLHHERIHSQSFKNRCDFCKFRSNDSERFREHVERHVTEYATLPFRCSLCPYGASKRKTLGTHKRRRHHGKETVNKEVPTSSSGYSDTVDVGAIGSSSCKVPIPSNPELSSIGNTPLQSCASLLTTAETEPHCSIAGQQFFTNMLLSDDVESQPLPSSALLLPANARMYLSSSAMNAETMSRYGFEDDLFANLNNVERNMYKQQ